MAATHRRPCLMHRTQPCLPVQELARTPIDLVGRVSHDPLALGPPLFSELLGRLVVCELEVLCEPAHVALRHGDAWIATAVRRAVEAVVEHGERE